MTLKMILIGTGGHGKNWCFHFLPPAVKEGKIKVVAAVDMNPNSLINAKEGLGLLEEQCYSDAKLAFEQHPEADFCVLVVPPQHRENLVDLALSYNLHILSEKPIADTLEASIRIAEKVRSSGKKMAITMNRRYEQDKVTFRNEVHSGNHGQLDYLVFRHTCNLRTYGSWGNYRHDLPYSLLIESGSHRLDILSDLANAKCDVVYTESWNPSWGEYARGSQALVTLRFENGVRALFEGAYSNAAGLNGFGTEYIRAECQQATIILDRKEIMYMNYIKDKPEFPLDLKVEVPPLNQSKWEHHWLIEKFILWIENNEVMETSVDAQLQSAAICSAAIESAIKGRPIEVQAYLENCKKQI